ncbi:HAD-like domain-containing protein [Plectosphaerella cucumerina]|uniref:HAD-like domain-containing protein n=1 Tax=Plectosphaerella cucumerina TaxID=40658 RepID=A0A8K0TCJ6_9PEZI|nr:HAD-like domain-containing protein [Plectosphaerella cucumerina]
MTSKPLHLVLDFDGTITQQDTIGVLADLGQDFQLRQKAKISPTWAQIVEEYGRDHKEYSTGYQPASDQRSSIEDELVFLRQLRSVEHRSLRRVERSGLFRGLDEETLKQGGRDALRNGTIQLRDGFTDIMAAASHNKWHISVLSVNWSTSFLRGVLEGYPVLDVVANEILPDGRIVGPGHLGTAWKDSPLMTCEDKREALSSLLLQQGSCASDLVYFGDSTCDIECLTLGRGVAVALDIGSTLMRTLERVGVNVPSVADRQQSDALVWARSFQEVLDAGFL